MIIMAKVKTNDHLDAKKYFHQHSTFYSLIIMKPYTGPGYRIDLSSLNLDLGISTWSRKSGKKNPS